VLKSPGAADVRPAGKAPCPEVEDLFVADAHRRRGVGELLLTALEREARAWGFDRVGLSVGIANDPARRLYERRRYRDLGYPEFFISGTYVDADGKRRRWEEKCVYLVKRLDGDV
jgi:GNAT superfamily N-acetyltransferase